MKQRMIDQLTDALDKLKQLDGDIIAVSNGELLDALSISVIATPKGEMSIQVDISIGDQ